MGSSTLAVLAAAVLAGLAAWNYLRRELPVPRRGVLLALRATTLGLLAVVVLRPELRMPGSVVSAEWTVVDRSASMSMAAPGVAPPADRAAGRDLPPDGARTLAFGEDGDGERPGSRLAPALRRAAEGGARSVTVLTDLRVADGPTALAEAERLGLRLRLEDLGAPLASAGIAELSVPGAGRGGDEVAVEATVFATAPLAGAPAVVRLVRRDPDGEEATVAVDTVPLPAPGGLVAVRSRIRLPEVAGTVLWRAEVRAAGDDVGDDDARHAATRVDPLSGIVALVSVRPDWEPRWLLPVLAEATGLPVRGWLRVGADRFLSMGDGGSLSADSLARVLREARIAVVHGVEADGGPPWLAPVLAESPRLLLLSGPGGAGGVAGVQAGDPLPGEWYPDPDAPAPFAGVLSGLDLAPFPPLAGAAPLPGSAGTGGRENPAGAAAEPGLVLTRPGGGRGVAVLLAEAAGRRVAEATARGFWRWAARGGDPAEAHRRLFSAVAGWLLELDAPAAAVAVGPVRPVASALEPVAWELPPEATVEVRLEEGDGTVRTDTLRTDAVGRTALPVPAPGVVRWQVTRLDAPGTAATAGETQAGPEPGPWSGLLVVEAWTDELRWPRDTLLAAGVAGVRSAAAATAPGVPFRATPWPWLVAVLLLCSEWVLRRRWGLR